MVAVIMLSFVAVICIGVIIGMCASGEVTNEGSEIEETEIEYIEISANDIYAAFQENEIAANEKYKGKAVKITGVVSDINAKDVLTSANILLDVDDTFFVGSVQCNFNSDYSKALANVQKGQSVTIIGTCNGLSTFNVMINACQLQ